MVNPFPSSSARGSCKGGGRSAGAWLDAPRVQRAAHRPWGSGVVLVPGTATPAAAPTSSALAAPVSARLGLSRCFGEFLLQGLVPHPAWAEAVSSARVLGAAWLETSSSGLQTVSEALLLPGWCHCWGSWAEGPSSPWGEHSLSGGCRGAGLTLRSVSAGQPDLGGLEATARSSEKKGCGQLGGL